MGEYPMHLRLTGSGALKRPGVVVDRTPAPEVPVSRDAVAREMRAASLLSADDARRIVALRVVESLEGGRAAILRPEARRSVVAMATAHGLRPFDANLVIAIVQDGARRGEGPESPDIAGRLRLVGGGAIERKQRRVSVMRHVVINLVAAAVLGIGVAAVLVAWLLGR